MQVYINKITADAKIPGAAVSIIKNKRIINIYTGFKNSEKKTQIDHNTIYLSASLSKVVFSYCILKLVELKILELDTPLSTYTNLKAISKSYASTNFNKITTRMILSHTSGLQNDGKNKILFTPGTRFFYSGDGFKLLQLVVEQITKEPINNIINRYVFIPFNMINSSFVYRSEYKTRITSQHDYYQRVIPNIIIPERIKSAHVAGSLFTTLVDYGIFLTKLSNDENIINMMLEKQIKLSKNIYWGLGVPVEIINGKKMIWHWGDNLYFRHFFIYDLVNSNGMILFTNSYNGLSIVDKLSYKIFHKKFASVLELKKLTEGRFLHEQYDNPLRIKRLLILDDFLTNGSSALIEWKKWLDTLNSKDKLEQMNVLIEEFNTWLHPQNKKYIKLI